MTMIHLFDDIDIIVGQGTIGLDLAEDCPQLGTVIVPLSGGGLMSGISFTFKNYKSIHGVGVSMDRGPAIVESSAKGKLVEIIEEPSLTDALIGG